ncbi:uncharacterized protein KGF55_001486 [Candida pseudojiufengensis]|uniref:uncharacterized protein n=1 Tax=Candida pseudojiufengensis TaxID=497109 RepID=UPI00222498F9|nr:uncharacterized protein KGF55_001486 [Candida pseudojiufengensis]KAI5965266.1 hypothetical protein KGF55_001486 [Candida pseudojiufengensis]
MSEYPTIKFFSHLHSTLNGNGKDTIRKNQNLKTNSDLSINSQNNHSWVKKASVKFSNFKINKPESIVKKENDEIIDEKNEININSNSVNTFDNMTNTPLPQQEYISDKDFPHGKLISRMEEIIKTNKTYLNDCKELNRSYLSIFELPECESPIPFIIVKECLLKLIEIHDELNKQFEEIEKHTSNGVISNIEKIMTSIAKEGLNVFYYLNYCSNSTAIHELNECFKTDDEDELDPDLEISNGTIKKKFKVEDQFQFKLSIFKHQQGIQNVLNSENTGEFKRNLSFQALHHNGIMKIFQYKNFACNSIKDMRDLEKKTINLEKVLKEINNKISIINKENDSNSINSKLNEIIDFSNYLNINHKYFNFKKLHYKFNQLISEFFGKPLFIGSGFVIYIKENKPVLKHSIIILFKCHLIILGYVEPLKRTCRYKKFKPKFIIPLVKCSIIYEKSDTNGIQFNFNNGIKLRFAIQSIQFEIILGFLTLEDYNEWYEKLDLLINHVHNGNYIDKVNDGFVYLNQVPKNISAFEIIGSNKSLQLPLECCYKMSQFKVNLKYFGGRFNNHEHSEYVDKDKSFYNLYLMSTYISRDHKRFKSIQELINLNNSNDTSDTTEPKNGDTSEDKDYTYNGKENPNFNTI